MERNQDIKIGDRRELGEKVVSIIRNKDGSISALGVQFDRPEDIERAKKAVRDFGIAYMQDLNKPKLQPELNINNLIFD